MTIPNAEHLLDQAERLIAPGGRGAPRQVDLRRAISNSYYALFHAVSIASADQFVGKRKQSDPLYSLVYRSIDHRALREFCDDVGKQTLPKKYIRYVPRQWPPLAIQAFALAVVELQGKRHSADYDPMTTFSPSEARLAIRTARRALTLFKMVGPQSQNVFLTLLLFPPR
ncbi:MAG: hypothetical protein AB7H90_18965 [Alphaproteobacteria bacterium]